jgi:pyridoxal phosphate enzyme (YggS family)
LINQIQKEGIFVEDTDVIKNRDAVLKEIAKACERSGRDPEEVTLIAVSKTKPEEMIQALYDNGTLDFGENYVQELDRKIEDLPKDIRWHMIGHLQRNKVKYVVGRTAMIHSIDTMRLAEAVSRESVKKNVLTQALIEVNVAEEENKFGFKLDEVIPFLKEASVLPNIKFRGLMTSAPYVADPEENRKYFRALKKLEIDINRLGIDNIQMDTLSMGMTNDYKVAVEEGATCVRVGTAIFGARDYSKN